MNINKKHEELVIALAKPGHDILDELTPITAHLLHMAVGVSGESGELLDAVKKHVLYGKPLDRENIIAEAGDILFYLEGVLAAVGASKDDAMAHNIIKLGARYSSMRYSNDQAIARADEGGVDATT